MLSVLQVLLNCMGSNKRLSFRAKIGTSCKQIDVHLKAILPLLMLRGPGLGLIMVDIGPVTLPHRSFFLKTNNSAFSEKGSDKVPHNIIC